MEIYRGATYEVIFVNKVKVEVVLPDELLDKAMAGYPGEGQNLYRG